MFRYFIENFVFELVGVLVYSFDKVGKDVGEFVGLLLMGVIVIDDVE